ncbi:hypothetical protein CB0940_08152 [Cercospora beticola]|uniref:Chitin-binding type-4 domain-containing protein n=1 Tax=Cercospora beticola TaxID=122368 RepID=A0A2G5HR83_CERBT|nr:hypothetical protein CB0940_08152 [Cercospora beticola]PIA95054.1 hypothetical protein CB0940_08152 [Cercospora beticola]WPB04717.1 hypothetical protein RHO25_009364 [Cercospora beticola]
MHFPLAIAAIALFLASTSAHMQLFYPAPFNASNNPHRTSTTADPYLEFPYNCCGDKDRWMYPCRGYESLLNTPDGAPTATWRAGDSANFILWGPTSLGGNHYGGSCQIGFSTDGGSTFHVATSYEGNCPHRNNGVGPEGQNFEFVVPSDLAPGVQLFAWIWYNREQELNMNCAAVEIVAPEAPIGYARDTRSSASTSMPFDARPLMFVADNGNDCETPHSTAELKFPEPGPEVVVGDGVYPLELPKGACGQKEMLAKQGYYVESRGDEY